MSKKRTTATYNIPLDNKREIEQLAIKVGYETGTPMKWTEFMLELIDRYAKDTAHDLIEEHKAKKALKKVQ